MSQAQDDKLQSLGGIKNFFVGNKPDLTSTENAFFSLYDTYRSDPISAKQAAKSAGYELNNVDDLIAIGKHYGIANEEAFKFVQTAEKVPGTIKKGQQSAVAFTNSFQSGLQGLGSSLKKLGSTILSTLGKAALSAGISWLVSEGISLVAKVAKWLWDEVLTDNGKKKRAEESLQKFDEASSTYKETSKSVSELTDKYEELSEKLKDTNLTVEEQLQIKSDLSDLQDTLVEKYGTEASRLDLVNGKYEEQLELLNNISKEKARDYLYGTEGVMNANKDGKNAVELAQEYINQRPETQTIRVADQYGHEHVAGTNLALGENIAEGVNLGGNNNPSLMMFAGFDIKSLMKKYDKLSEYQAEGEVHIRFDEKATKKEIYDQLTSFLSDIKKEVGSDPTELQLNLIGSIERDINNLGFDSTKYNQYMDDLKTAARAEMAFSGDKGVNNLETDAQSAINAYNKALAEYERDQNEETTTAYHEAQKQLNLIKRRFNQYNPSEELKEGYQAIYQEVMSKRVKSIDEQLSDTFGDAENEAVKQGWRKRIQSLSNKEKIQLQTEIGDNAKVLTLQGLDALIRDCQEKANKTPIEIESKVDASDAVDTMADMKTAVTSLEDLWNQTIGNKTKLGKDKKYLSEDGTVSKELDTKNLAMGYADPATLNSVESAFYKFSEQLEKSGNDAAANKINLALKEFQKTLVETPGDAEAAQKAIDNLITAYVDQTDAIKNLTEENKEWSVAQLEAMGVTNAEAVVSSRLNKTIKKLLSSTKSLSKTLNDNADALELGAEGGAEYETALTNVATSLTTMFKDAFGDDFNINLNGAFVAQNLDLIRQAAIGDAEALNQLRAEAAKEIVAKIEIDATDSHEIEGIQNYINSLIDGFDIENIDIGTSVDTEPLIIGLNSLVKAGEITRDSMNRILSSIGVEPEIDEVTTKIQAKIKDYGLSGTGAEQARRGLQYAMTGEIKVPSIHYKLANKATGAKYTPSTTPSSSSTGDSKNKNGDTDKNQDKLQEDTKETFDWIEVKIQRIDEAIARLDKTVGNTYKTWGKRNKALREELKKVAEEVKVHEHAQKRYLENAKALKISDVNKKPKKADYSDNKEQYEYDLGQYKQAVNDWKTGKYQKLVREGKIGKDDIQHIDNKYLADAIKQYTELYNKAVQAGDAVEDDKIKISELNKMKFDNIKSEYEGLISLIDDRTNKYEEQLNHAQARSYNMTRKLYSKEMQTNDEVLVKRQKELSKLQTKLNEAVKNGSIKKNSEAWVQMKNEINAVKLAIEQCTTKTIELNKEVFNSIKEEYDGIVSLIENTTSIIDERINRAQEHGYAVSKKWYQQELKENDKTLKKRRNELAKLEQQLQSSMAAGIIKKGSAAWVEMQGEINAVKSEIEQCTTKTVELNNAIRQIDWDAFDFVVSQVDRVTSETELLIDTLDSKSLFKDNGEFTKRGRATEALYGIQYDVAAKKAKLYQQEYEKVQKELANDPHNQTLIDRVNQLKDGWDEAVKSMNAARDSMVNLISQGINKNIAALNELIKKYTQALSDAKSLYDYQKNVKNQVKNITSLEKQLSAYSGDTSEEAKATVQQIRNSLEEARTGLKETEWDKYISETNDMLNTMSQDYQDYMDKWLEDVNRVFTWGVNDINDHATEIGKTINSVAEANGVKLTDTMKDILSTSKGQSDLVSQYANGIITNQSSAASALTELIKYVKEIADGNKTYNKVNTESGVSTNNAGSTSNTKQQNTNTKKQKEQEEAAQKDNLNKQKEKDQEEQRKQEEANNKKQYNAEKSELYMHYSNRQKDLKNQIAGIKNKITSIKKDYKDMINSAKTKKQKTNLEIERQEILDQYDAELKDAQTLLAKVQNEYNKELNNLNKKYGYATGSSGIKNNQLAWTQEKGSEIIFRKTDGAMLTPLNTGDMVFTADMSKNLWDLAKNPNLFGTTVNLPDSAVGLRTVNNDNNLTVVLPNVMNYEDFRTAMMNDPKITNYMQAATIGQALGKGKLNRGNL